MLRKQRLKKVRSKHGIVVSEIDVKSWLADLPTVSQVRPARCASCGVASRPHGGNLAVHGHGLVSRQIRGPPDVDDKSEIVVVEVRRYECQRCGAVMTVVPRGVLHGMLYAAQAIALALFLYGVEARCAREIRARLCAWPAIGASATGWPSLRRWIARASSLWRSIRPSLPKASTRQRAERAAMTLVAHAQIGGDDVARVFDGAVRAR